MNEPKADDSGFKLHLTVELSSYWDNILDEAIVIVDDGFGAEKVLKELERDEFWPKERWVDFTKFSCNSKTKSISICLRDITRHEKCVDIPQKFLYGREELMINVESVYPEDRIQLWTRNPDKSHCFSGGSVMINKNGRQVNDADISQLFGQYTFVIRDSSSQSQYSQCSANAGYDFIVTSHHGLSLGSATLGLEQNKISLEEDGKGVRVHSLEAFVPCLSRSATIRELVIGGPTTSIQSDPSRRFNLQPFLSPCKESVFQLEYWEKGRYELDLVHVAKHITVEEPDEKTREIKINDEDFQHCQNLMVELQCYDSDSGFYKSVMNSTSRVFPIEEYEEYNCRARVWIDERYAKYAEFVTVLDPITTMEWVLIGVGIGVAVVIIAVILGVCLTRNRRNTRERPGYRSEMVQLKSERTRYPDEDTV